MQKLASRNPAQVLDLLNARLTFERTGVQLYDAAIRKIEERGAEPYRAIVGTLGHHRDEEQEHADWLEQQIRSLGGSPGARTDMALLEEEESRGIRSVIVDGHGSALHVLHALLAAELADNAGWDVLVELAGDAGDGAAKLAFARRLAEEARHLLFLRETIQRAVDIEILGMERRMPSRQRVAIASQLAKPIMAGLLGVAIGGAIGAGIAWSVAQD